MRADFLWVLGILMIAAIGLRGGACAVVETAPASVPTAPNPTVEVDTVGSGVPSEFSFERTVHRPHGTLEKVRIAIERTSEGSVMTETSSHSKLTVASLSEGEYISLMNGLEKSGVWQLSSQAFNGDDYCTVYVRAGDAFHVAVFPTFSNDAVVRRFIGYARQHLIDNDLWIFGWRYGTASKDGAWQLLHRRIRVPATITARFTRATTAFPRIVGTATDVPNCRRNLCGCSRRRLEHPHRFHSGAGTYA